MTRRRALTITVVVVLLAAAAWGRLVALTDGAWTETP